MNIEQSTTEYLAYIREHRDYIRKAWDKFQRNCPDEPIVYDDWRFAIFDIRITNHDLSKYSLEEFAPYRDKFYTSDEVREWYKKSLPKEQYIYNNGEKMWIDPNPDVEIDRLFEDAWEHHYLNNDHHPENWTKQQYLNSDAAIEMILDWEAMGMARGEGKTPAYDWYDKTMKPKGIFNDQQALFIEHVLERFTRGIE